MENEERIPVKTKQAWQTPEIIDLDLDLTAGKTDYITEVDTANFGAS